MSVISADIDDERLELMDMTFNPADIDDERLELMDRTFISEDIDDERLKLMDMLKLVDRDELRLEDAFTASTPTAAPGPPPP